MITFFSLPDSKLHSIGSNTANDYEISSTPPPKKKKNKQKNPTNIWRAERTCGCCLIILRLTQRTVSHYKIITRTAPSIPVGILTKLTWPHSLSRHRPNKIMFDRRAIVTCRWRYWHRVVPAGEWKRRADECKCMNDFFSTDASGKVPLTTDRHGRQWRKINTKLFIFLHLLTVFRAI